MADACQTKEEDGTIGFRKSKNASLTRTTLASVESLTVPMVQEVVLLADFQCAGCQKRVADIISRMNGETESVVVSVMEKKVTVTCGYPSVRKVPGRQVATISKMNKISVITRLFRSSFSRS
ncbi:uncharacterized protein LOC127806586 isoform X1 [Diospyros lotus]|uniref:uncharacterized protein LOC127806586 isoform X1 n=1 Tax=Diospyros lotus TaxID=55363 RepID=UPI00224E76BE|nr:uncharacterized protein LOC127806586 isoform X1 [Diospyros lotus]